MFDQNLAKLAGTDTALFKSIAAGIFHFADTVKVGGCSLELELHAMASRHGLQQEAGFMSSV